MKSCRQSSGAISRELTGELKSMKMIFKMRSVHGGTELVSVGVDYWMPGRMKARRPQRQVAPGYRYDRRVARYRSETSGRFVAWRDVASALNEYLRVGTDRMSSISERLINRNITLADWIMEMQQEIKRSHLVAAALGKGGWDRLTAADFGRVGASIRDQYRFLRQFAEQIQTGQQKLNGRLIRRSQLYVQSARAFHTEFEREQVSNAGYTEERRVLGQAEHCEDCIEYASRGWVPIGTLPEIGIASKCRQNCHCHFEYR